MSFKKVTAYSLFVLFFALLYCGIYFAQPDISNRMMDLSFSVESAQEGTLSVYYSEDETFSDVPSAKQDYSAGQSTEVQAEVPVQAAYLKLQFSQPVSEVTIGDAGLQIGKTVLEKEAGLLENPLSDSGIDSYTCSNNRCSMKLDSDSASVVLKLDPEYQTSVLLSMIRPFYRILKILGAGIVTVLAVLLLRKFRQFSEIPFEVIKNWKLIRSLSRNDFKTKFAGSTFGILWAFVQPMVTIFLYWFVFEKALHAGGQSVRSGITVPFVLWLIAGLVPWFYFQDVLNAGTNSLIEYHYLVKKVVFKISILPMVKVISSLYVHAFFVVFAVVMFACYGFTPDLYTLQVLYYSLCLVALAMGFAYLNSSIVVFFRDFSQMVNIFLQMFVWVTPIMWNIDSGAFSPVIVSILKLNPLFYVVNGYRDSLINKRWFFEYPGMTVYFWVFVLVLCGTGFLVFRRLRTHFADVL